VKKKLSKLEAAIAVDVCVTHALEMSLHTANLRP
jgi:hypothetical protein